ncbi:MAG: hypothetical protein LCH43_11460 [Actinobacteria bacterium]|nr:hypothetical protein [Actinomycetota bacterium]
MTIINPGTGEVDDLDFVPLDLAGLDESELLAMFPTPVQCAGALLIARHHIASAPAVIAARSKALKDAKRALIVARGYAMQRAEGRTAEIRKAIAESDSDVISAWEHIDTCELALEYARERRKSLSEDIEILRSLNANFRGEHQ